MIGLGVGYPGGWLGRLGRKRGGDEKGEREEVVSGLGGGRDRLEKASRDGRQMGKGGEVKRGGDG